MESFLFRDCLLEPQLCSWTVINWSTFVDDLLILSFFQVILQILLNRRINLDFVFIFLKHFISLMNRPVALVCYICGRQFGTKSLAIHIKSCMKKWENQENLKPPKQRRPCPQPPKGLSQLTSKTNVTKQDMNSYNTNSYDTFVEEALVQCEICTRRFNPKSLGPHQVMCRKSPMIKKHLSKVEQKEEKMPSKVTKQYSFEPQGSDSQNDQSQNLAPCRSCGRKFATDRLAKHEKVCHADPVKKPVNKNQMVSSKPTQVPKSKPNFALQKKAKWKVQHEELQAAMSQMRQMKAIEAKGGKLSDLPPPPRGNYDHYVECKYCGRKYAKDVAERHIPKCANIINKPGGIKTSKIQEKYVQGSGVAKSKPDFNYNNDKMVKSQIENKPMISMQKGNQSSVVTGSNIKNKPNFNTKSKY